MESSELTKWVTLSPTKGSELLDGLRVVCATLQTQAFVEGAGEVEFPTISLLHEDGSRAERKLSGVWDMISLHGTVLATGEARLYVLLAREGGSGPLLLGGQLLAATIRDVVMRASVARTDALPAPPARAAEASVEAAAAAAPAEAGSGPILLPAAPAPPPGPAPAAPAPAAAAGSAASGPALPKRPVSRAESVLEEAYPEEGDIVEHFAFGRCTVLLSDGERIRLQQDKDGRVREVALSMLKIGEPSLDADGKRTWQLTRKN